MSLLVGFISEIEAWVSWLEARKGEGRGENDKAAGKRWEFFGDEMDLIFWRSRDEAYTISFWKMTFMSLFGEK